MFKVVFKKRGMFPQQFSKFSSETSLLPLRLLRLDLKTSNTLLWGFSYSTSSPQYLAHRDSCFLSAVCGEVPQDVPLSSSSKSTDSTTPAAAWARGVVFPLVPDTLDQRSTPLRSRHRQIDYGYVSRTRNDKSPVGLRLAFSHDGSLHCSDDEGETIC